MPKPKKNGFIDPLSLIAIGFLVTTLVVAVSVTNNPIKTFLIKSLAWIPEGTDSPDTDTNRPSRRAQRDEEPEAPTTTTSTTGNSQTQTTEELSQTYNFNNIYLQNADPNTIGYCHQDPCTSGSQISGFYQVADGSYRPIAESEGGPTKDQISNLFDRVQEQNTSQDLSSTTLNQYFGQPEDTNIFINPQTQDLQSQINQYIDTRPDKPKETTQDTATTQTYPDLGLAPRTMETDTPTVQYTAQTTEVQQIADEQKAAIAQSLRDLGLAYTKDDLAQGPNELSFYDSTVGAPGTINSLPPSLRQNALESGNSKFYETLSTDPLMASTINSELINCYTRSSVEECNQALESAAETGDNGVAYYLLQDPTRDLAAVQQQLLQERTTAIETAVVGYTGYQSIPTILNTIPSVVSSASTIWSIAGGSLTNVPAATVTHLSASTPAWLTTTLSASLPAGLTIGAGACLSNQYLDTNFSACDTAREAALLGYNLDPYGFNKSFQDTGQALYNLGIKTRDTIAVLRSLQRIQAVPIAEVDVPNVIDVAPNSEGKFVFNPSNVTTNVQTSIQNTFGDRTSLSLSAFDPTIPATTPSITTLDVARGILNTANLGIQNVVANQTSNYFVSLLNPTPTSLSPTTSNWFTNTTGQIQNTWNNILDQNIETPSTQQGVSSLTEQFTIERDVSLGPNASSGIRVNFKGDPTTYTPENIERAKELISLRTGQNVEIVESATGRLVAITPENTATETQNWITGTTQNRIDQNDAGEMLFAPQQTTLTQRINNWVTENVANRISNWRFQDTSPESGRIGPNVVNVTGNVPEPVENKNPISNLIDNVLSRPTSQNIVGAQRLADDVTAIKQDIGNLSQTISNNGGSDPNRVLAVVSAGGDANTLLPKTLTQMIQQLNEVGKQADIIVGLNNGFDGSPTINNIRSTLPNTEVVILRAATKTSASLPAQIFDLSGQSFYIGQPTYPNQNRVIFIEQPTSQHAQGKIRMLNDIYGLVESSINNGWNPPTYTITFDAESRFLNRTTLQEPQIGSNGLSTLIYDLESNPSIDLIGTRNQFVVFENGDPDFSIPIGPMQQFLDLAHSSNGYSWDPGGGTAGKTEIITSITNRISTVQPSQRNEDTVLSILAREAGFNNQISQRVLSLNNTAPASNIEGTRNQILRWTAATKGLENTYGSLVSNSYLRPSMINNITTGVKQVVIKHGGNVILRPGEFVKEVRALLQGVPEFNIVNARANLSPDRPLDPNFSPSWVTPGQDSQVTSIPIPSPTQRLGQTAEDFFSGNGGAQTKFATPIEYAPYLALISGAVIVGNYYDWDIDNLKADLAVLLDKDAWRNLLNPGTLGRATQSLFLYNTSWRGIEANFQNKSFINSLFWPENRTKNTQTISETGSLQGGGGVNIPEPVSVGAEPQKIYPNSDAKVYQIDINSASKDIAGAKFLGDLFTNYSGPLDGPVLAKYLRDSIAASDEYRYLLNDPNFVSYINDEVSSWVGYTVSVGGVGIEQLSQCILYQNLLDLAFPNLKLTNIKDFPFTEANSVYSLADDGTGNENAPTYNLGVNGITLSSLINNPPQGSQGTTYSYYLDGNKYPDGTSYTIFAHKLASKNLIETGDTLIYGSGPGHMVPIIGAEHDNQDNLISLTISENNSPKGNLDGTSQTYNIPASEFEKMFGDISKVVIVREETVPEYINWANKTGGDNPFGFNK